MSGVEFRINAGDGAFYGPKIDFQVEDALGRWWQLGTIQLDYQMPQRFDLAYVAADGSEQPPVMIHRAMLGSVERFLGILIEHTAGAFPLWLAPVQAKVLPVSEKALGYGRELTEKLRSAGLRGQLDDSNEKLGYKIRQAQLEKIPYMLVVGEKEAAAGTVSVRLRTGKEVSGVAVERFVPWLAERARVRTGALADPADLK